MSTHRRQLALAAALITALVSSVGAEPPPDRGLPIPAGDQPRVAIIQYASGRILVVREINGELQAIEPGGQSLDVLRRFLNPAHGQPALRTVQNARSAPGAPGDAADPVAADGYPFFYNPYWYAQRDIVNTNERGDASAVGRATERLEQRAAEARQQVRARRAEVGETGVTNIAGQVYPLTAAEQEHIERLQEARGRAGGGHGDRDPYLSFYNLAFGLEESRQQELAARKELALLSYDVLLREGLQFFHQRQYGQAARAFIGAALKDQGDAASRLHAAQALMANGLHSEAMIHVRRAFELAPGLIHRPLNHRTSYAFPEDYDDHLADLVAYVEDHPEDDDALVLLAYQQFFSSQPFAARDALRQVKERLARADGFARKLVAAAEPVMGKL